jgi:flagellar basal body-associated protein FliL
MADEEQAQEEPKKGGPGWLVALLMGIAGLGAGFGGAAVVMPNQISAGPAQEDPAKAGDSAPVETSFAERVVKFDPFIVNVSGEGYPRYLKVEIALEMDSLEAKEDVAQRIAQVRDLTILLLSTKRLGDVEGFEGKALLKDDLRERVNALITTGEVQSVLFTEFVVQ